MQTLKSILLAVTFSASFLLTACGGGGSSSGGSSASSAAAAEPDTIEGPLDAVQEPLSSQVMVNLASAVGGTPLEVAVECLDQVLVGDVVDVLDAVLVNVSPDNANDPQALFQQSAADLERSVNNLTEGLMAFQSALAGGTCQATAGTNPLAGTPLAPLGDALAAATAGGVPSDPSALAAYVTGLSEAFQQGMAALSSPDFETVDVPVLGGMLSSLQESLSQLDTLFQAIAAQDASAAQAAIVQTLDSVLNDVLLSVVPIADIEEASGNNPLFSLPVGSAVFGLTGLLGGDFSSLLAPDFDSGFSAAVTDLLGPLSEVVNPDLFGQISDALTSASGAGGTTGTPLDAVLDPLAPIEDLVTGVTGSNDLSGLPIDMLLTTVADALSAEESCPLGGTYLDATCGVVQGLLDALLLGPIVDGVTTLTGLVTSLL